MGMCARLQGYKNHGKYSKNYFANLTFGDFHHQLAPGGQGEEKRGHIMLTGKTHRLIGNETQIKIGHDDKLVKGKDGWQAEKRPFAKPIKYLRDARAAYKSQNKK